MTIGIDARLFGQGLGLGRYISKLIQHLEQCDDTYRYVIFLRRQNFDMYRPRNPRFRKVCVDVAWYSLAEQMILPWHFLKERCDLLHVPHFNIPLLYPGKMIVTIHDLTLLTHPGSATVAATTRHPIIYRLKYAAYRIVLRYALDRACRIIAVSQAVAGDICAYAPAIEDKIVVVPEAADELPRGAVPESVSRYGERRFFLYAGNAYPHKNITTLLSAMENVHTYAHDARLILCGQEDHFQKLLIKDIHVRGAQRFISHVGCVSDETLRWLYERAIAVVLPSYAEGFGLQILEASRHGCPVICSAIPAYRETGGDAALYVDSSIPGSVAHAMLSLLHDERARRALLEAGKIRAQQFSWQSTAEMTKSLYHVCLSKKD